MKGLAVEIKKIQFPKGGLKLVDFLLIVLLILAGIILLPLFLIFLIGGVLFNLLTPEKKYQVVDDWNEIKTNSDINLKYKWANVDDIPNYLYNYFDPRPLILFESDPEIIFFNGYFTDLKIERIDGIFVQKVNCNKDSQEIISLPLCFFKFDTQEVEEIKDLKGYEIDTKGNPNDFMLTGYGEGYELQIHLKKE